MFDCEKCLTRPHGNLNRRQTENVAHSEECTLTVCPPQTWCQHICRPFDWPLQHKCGLSCFLIEEVVGFAYLHLLTLWCQNFHGKFHPLSYRPADLRRKPYSWSCRVWRCLCCRTKEARKWRSPKGCLFSDAKAVVRPDSKSNVVINCLLRPSTHS